MTPPAASTRRRASRPGSDPAGPGPATAARTGGLRSAGFPRFAGEQTYEAAADITALADHPDNPRMGDDQAVADSIAANGWYGVILAQTSTRRVLAGHTRRRDLLAGGATRAPVLWLDVDDDTARRILVADNRTAELASWDDEKLLQLLDGATERDLAGMGFTADALAALAADMGDVPDQREDDPDPAARRRTMLARYEDGAARQMVLVWPRAEYDEIVVQLEHLRQAAGAETFAAVVGQLVRDAAAAADAE